MGHPPLGKLSPELRNIIYELILVDDVPIRLHLARARTRRPAHSVKTVAALTQTCSQIRGESRQLYYANNEFFVIIPHTTVGLAAAHLNEFIGVIGSTNAKLIKKVDIAFDHPRSSAIYPTAMVFLPGFVNEIQKLVEDSVLNKQATITATAFFMCAPYPVPVEVDCMYPFPDYYAHIAFAKVHGYTLLEQTLECARHKQWDLMGINLRDED